MKNLLFYIKKNHLMFNLFLLAIFGYLAKYLFNLLLAQYITPDLFGDFNLATRVLNILTSFALLGTDNASKRFLAYYLNKNDRQALHEYIYWNMRLISISFSICIFLGLCTFVIMHGLHLWNVKDIRTYHLTIYMLWVAPLAALFALLGSYILCAHYAIFYKFMQRSKNLSHIGVFILALLLIEMDFNGYTLALILCLSFTLLILYEILFLIRKTPLLFQHILAACRNRETRQVPADWMKVSIRLTLNGLFFLLVCTTDLMIVEIVSPNEASVGFYAVALLLSGATQVVPKNLYTFIKPQVQQLIETNEGKQQLEQRLRQINRFSLFITVLISLGIFLFSKPLLLHFGPSYLQADLTLKILVVGFMIGAYSQAATTVLAFSGYESTLLNNAVFEIILLIILGVSLTYYYDIVGTALATTITILLKTLFLHLYTYRKTHIKAYAI